MEQINSSSNVRIPSRPDVPDPNEILSLYHNDELRTSPGHSNSVSLGNTFARDCNEVEGTLIPPRLPPMAIAVAVPVENTVNEAIAHATAVFDEIGMPSAPAVSSLSVKEQDREAKARAIDEIYSSQTFSTLPDSAVAIVQTPEDLIANANAIAQVRADEDYMYRQKGVIRFHANGSIQSERVHEANRIAHLRDQEGLEVDASRHDYEQKIALAQRDCDAKQTSEETKNPYKSDPNQSGYQIKDYETADYTGYEYKSDYDYKSVYD